MSLKAPKLDDRSFHDLLQEAKRRVQQKGDLWTDLSPSDPGVVLLELFAFLTEVMLYRLNRLPEKAYVEFLNLLGVERQPPAAATVDLLFYRNQASDSEIAIPRNTRVTVSRGRERVEPPVFITVKDAVLPAGDKEVTVRAYHCEAVEGELVGRGTGLPGQSAVVARPPLIAPTGDPLDLVVAVEARSEELDARIPAIQYQEKTYRVWREAPHFAGLGPDEHVYLVDRVSGRITFAPAVQLGSDPGLEEVPALLAAVPGADREIRVWYRRGGGPDGNVAEEKLTTLKDAIPGLKVTNPARATGGKPAETLENALARGPQELHSLQRAVTAKDFELIARSHSARSVARAKAFTRAELWRHAAPGHVEVLLVPDLPEDERARLTLEALRDHETAIALEQIRSALDDRRPLGTTCVVNWARYKRVRVQATVVAQQEEDLAALRRRIVERLYQTITPLPTPYNATGWRFGQSLRASDVYDIALREPGVRWVEKVRLLVDEVPDQEVSALAIDHFQPRTWYAGSGPRLFRSLNDGEGWEAIGEEEGAIIAVAAHPRRAGLVAMASRAAEGDGSRVRLSADCGETWDAGNYKLAFNVHDLAWSLRDDVPVLFLATEVGLYEIVLRPGGSPVQVLVEPADQDRGFYAVLAYTDPRGLVTVAAAGTGLGGIYLSTTGGRPNSFRRIDKNMPGDEDIRALAVQYDGPRAFLWAGAAATGGDAGRGCYRWELRGAQDPPEGWVAFSEGWEGGSCRGLAFHGTQVFAASHRLGVLRLDAGKSDARWQAPRISCGLPLREREQERLFYPVDAIASSPARLAPLIMAGGAAGVYRSLDEGENYEAASSVEFGEKVALPDTWLFVSGAHEVEVVGEDEA